MLNWIYIQMAENAVLDKSYVFALHVIQLYKFLCDENKEYVLSKQLLSSGTSIGASVNEAQAAISKKNLLQKCLYRVEKQEKVNIG